MQLRNLGEVDLSSCLLGSWGPGGGWLRVQGWPGAHVRSPMAGVGGTLAEAEAFLGVCFVG